MSRGGPRRPKDRGAGKAPDARATGALAVARDLVVPGVLLVLGAALVVLLLAGCGSVTGSDAADAGGSDRGSGGTGTHRPVPSARIPGSTPKAPADFVGPVRTVAVNGVELGFRQFGSGPPLLMVMGRDGTMSMWGYRLPRALADAGFRVTMFDNRGTGRSSDDTSRPLTMQVMADDTVALADALGLERPTVVGWSMGGEIALTAAVRHPDRFGAIVTSGSDAGGRHYVEGDPAYEAVLSDPDASPADMLRLLFPDPASPAVADFVTGLGLYPDPELSEQIQDRQTAMYDAWFHDESTWDGLGRIRSRVVLTNGSRDVVNVPANAGLIAARIPGARAEIFDGLGHGMLFEAVDRFVALVKQAASS